MTATRGEIRELSDWEDVRFVLRSRSFDQVAPEDGYSEGIELQGRIIGDSLVMARGDAHVERRRIEGTLFRLPTLVMYEQEIVGPRLERILARIAAERDADGPARGDLVALSQEVLLEVMGALVGIRLETPDDLATFAEIFTALDDGGRVRHMVDMKRALAAGLEVQRRFERELFRPAWRWHEQLLADAGAGRAREDEVPNDLITLMLRNREHFDRWDEEVYLREATLFVIASIGTTTREIALCCDELEQWIDDHPEDAAKRTDAQFLAHAFAESCRYRQSIQDVGRTALEDVTLPSGARVRKGEPVRLSLVGANRDLLGSAADRFDPYREPPSTGGSYGLAFSDGRHTCIGKVLVLGGSGDDDTRAGTAVSILHACYDAGMRRDPERAQVLKETTTKRFAEYPVVFEAI